MSNDLIDDCRSAFENWFLGENPTITDKRALERSGADSIYDLMTTRINWLAFEAGWNARRAPDDTALQEALVSSLETNQALSKKLALLKDAGITASKWMYSEIKTKKDDNERNYNPFVKLYDLLY